MDHTAPLPAAAFVHAIVEEDAASVWSLMSDTLRLCYAQSWAFNNGGDLNTAVRISQKGPSDPRWPGVAAAFLDGLRATLGNFVEVVLEGRLGLYSEVVPVGPDVEQVVFVDDRGLSDGFVVEASRPIEALRVFVQTTPQDQRVAGLKGSIPQPGWPPNMNARVDDDGWHRPSTMN